MTKSRALALSVRAYNMSGGDLSSQALTHAQRYDHRLAAESHYDHLRSLERGFTAGEGPAGQGRGVGTIGMGRMVSGPRGSHFAPIREQIEAHREAMFAHMDLAHKEEQE